MTSIPQYNVITFPMSRNMKISIDDRELWTAAQLADYFVFDLHDYANQCIKLKQPIDKNYYIYSRAEAAVEAVNQILFFRSLAK